MWLVRKTIVLLIAAVCFTAGAASAQKPFQLFIFGFDYGDQEVYFCDGRRLNELNTDMVLIHTLYPSEPSLKIDSIKMSYDSSQFAAYPTKRDIEIWQAAVASGPTYRPTRAGVDTVRIVGYYGPYLTEARIFTYARELTQPMLYGYSFTRYQYGGNAVDLLNYVLRDTLTDRLDGPYMAGTVNPSLGENKAITIRSCGGARIEEVKLESDFSEFTFHNLPTPGQSVPDSFAITYDFRPSIVGLHDRPISFRLSDGRWLTWRFQYRVRPASGVATTTKEDGLIVRSKGNTIEVNGAEGRVFVCDLLGRELNSGFAADGSWSFTASDLPRGIYFITSGHRSKKIVLP